MSRAGISLSLSVVSIRLFTLSKTLRCVCVCVGSVGSDRVESVCVHTRTHNITLVGSYQMYKRPMPCWFDAIRSSHPATWRHHIMMWYFISFSLFSFFLLFAFRYLFLPSPANCLVSTDLYWTWRRWRCSGTSESTRSASKVRVTYFESKRPLTLPSPEASDAEWDDAMMAVDQQQHPQHQYIRQIRYFMFIHTT